MESEVLTMSQMIDQLKTQYSYREISDKTEEEGLRISHQHIYRIHKRLSKRSLADTERVIARVHANNMSEEIGQ